MKPEEQRIAIAEACGWKKVPSKSFRGFLWQPPDKKGYDYEPPDYLNSMTAIREAEHVFDSDQAPWLHQLQLVVIGYDAHARKELLTLHLVNLINATAAQRAEAFLRTLNLWTS